MGSQPGSQQYKKPQAPPVSPEAEDADFKKQGVDQGKKVWPAVKDDKEKKPDAEPDDAGTEAG